MTTEELLVQNNALLQQLIELTALIGGVDLPPSQDIGPAPSSPPMGASTG